MEKYFVPRQRRGMGDVMKKRLTYLMITAATMSQILSSCVPAYGVETEAMMEASANIAAPEALDDDVDEGSVVDSALVAGYILNNEETEASYDTGSLVVEYEMDSEEASEAAEEDVFADEQEEVLEAMDGIIEETTVEEGWLYAASDITDLTEELKDYDLVPGSPYYFLKPSKSGIYYFVGDISELSIVDRDGASVKWTGTDPYNPWSASGSLDDSISVVAAELKANAEYEITIKTDATGTFYYYRAPAFCVKLIASPSAEDELLQRITYAGTSGSAVSFDTALYPLVQSKLDSKYYFLTYHPNRLPAPGKEPADNGDGTYSVELYDYFTGKLVGHSKDSGTVARAATCAKEGIMRYTCVCGETYDETIPKTSSHSWSAYNANGDRACSVCGAKQHDASKVIKTEPVYNIAGKPSKVKVKAAGGRKLTVTWKKPAKSKLKKIKGFYIEVATDLEFKNIVRTRKVKKSKNSFTFKKLKKGQRYYVRVRFYKGAQISRWSVVKYRKVK